MDFNFILRILTSLTLLSAVNSRILVNETTHSPEAFDPVAESVNSTDNVAEASDISALPKKIIQKAIGSISSGSLQPAASDNASDAEQVHKKWIEFGLKSRAALSEIIEDAMPDLLDLTLQMNLTSECITSILIVVQGIKDQQDWALRFVDSTAKTPSGILSGSVSDFGEYDECMAIRTPSDLDGDEFRGKYCIFNVRPSLPAKPKRYFSWHINLFNFTGTPLDSTVFDSFASHMAATYNVPMRLAVCLPSTCNHRDLSEFVLKFSNLSTFDIAIPTNCQVQYDQLILDNYQILSITLITSLLSIAIIGTVIDIYYRQKNGGKPKKSGNILEQLVLCFSIKTNANKLFTVNYNPDNLTCIHGLRVIMVFWSVMVHTYGFSFISSTLYRGLLGVMKNTESLSYQILSNAFILVDTFFMMSGLTLCYISLPLMEKVKGRINPVLYLTHRIIRTWPMLLGAISVNSLWPIFSKGPHLPDVSFMYESCQRNWWASMLFISNWFQGHDMCLIQSWYLSADTQLYLGAILLLILFYRSPKAGLYSVLVLCIITTAVSFSIVFVHDLPPSVVFSYMPTFETSDSYLQYTYYPTYQHIGSYAIGVATGYLILKHRRYPLNLAVQLVAWLLSLSFISFVLFFPTPWSRGLHPHKSLAALYAGFHRQLWALAMAWILYSCTSGRGGILNSFLSSSLFVPFSRLSFGLYLQQIAVIAFNLTQGTKDTRSWNEFEMLSTTISNFIWSTLLAFFCYLLFEAPFGTIEGILMRRSKPTLNKSSGESRDSKPRLRTSGSNVNKTTEQTQL